jgi:hypothetical protein
MLVCKKSLRYGEIIVASGCGDITLGATGLRG